MRAEEGTKKGGALCARPDVFNVGQSKTLHRVPEGVSPDEKEAAAFRVVVRGFFFEFLQTISFWRLVRFTRRLDRQFGVS